MVLLGIAGVAGSGKDFFASLAVNYLREIGRSVKRFALADEVKLQIDSFIQQNFGFSSFTTNRELKEQIRPLLIDFAETKKIHSGNNFWVKKLENQLRQFSHIDVSIVTDIRFPVEINWLKQNGGSLIHITRFHTYENGEARIPVEPNNQLESKNDPIIKENADIRFSWPQLIETEAQLEVTKFLIEGEKLWNKPCLLL